MGKVDAMPDASHQSLAAAMLEVQRAIRNPIKNRENPHYHQFYADLASILEIVRPLLSANGILLVQFPAFAENVVTLTTHLTHLGGEQLVHTFSTNVRDGSPQTIGSATTYLRRYALLALLAISAAEDDDDGARSHDPDQERSSADTRPTDEATGSAVDETKYLSPLQRKVLFAAWKAGGHDGGAVQEYLTQQYGTPTTNLVPKEDFEALCTRFKDKTPLIDPPPEA